MERFMHTEDLIRLRAHLERYYKHTKITRAIFMKIMKFYTEGNDENVKEHAHDPTEVRVMDWNP